MIFIKPLQVRTANRTPQLLTKDFYPINEDTFLALVIWNDCRPGEFI